MATSSALIKPILHKALAEGVYKDIVTKSSHYYYFLGKTLEWSDEANPPAPFNSYNYERQTRDEIITMKLINPSDVAYVIPRHNWTTGEIYDMYDDQYTTEIIGLDVIDGGDGYTSLPTITITGGGGIGAKFYPQVLDGQIIAIEDNAYLRAQGVSNASNGTGYISEPTVTITGGGGEGAIIRAKVNIAPSGAQALENAKFYVMTEDFNVYKCLDNNNSSQSMNKPLGTAVDPIHTDDGYVWKYMYTVPINLRGKFFSDEFIPVISALTNQFYSNGTIDTVVIDTKGSGYTYATIVVTGDGYIEGDPVLLTSINMVAGGTGYESPSVTFGDPFTGATDFASNTTTYLGQKIRTTNSDFYEVVAPGTLGVNAPTHRRGTVINGSVGLKYIGTTVKGIATASSGAISGVTLLGGVYDIEITNSGSGYTSAPNVVIGLLQRTIPTSAVNTTTNVITYTAHGLTTGTALVYHNGGGTAIAGLTNGNTYYAIRSTDDTFKLATTPSNATNGTAIDITGTGNALQYFTLPSSGTGATGVATLYGSSLSYATVTNQGDNYTLVPEVSFGTPWSPSTAVLVGEQYYYGANLYTVLGNGTTHASTAPTHTIAASATTAGSFTVGYRYTITSLGNTDWQAIGANYNPSVGDSFIATGVGSGTGTAKTTTVANGTSLFDYVGVKATGTASLRYGYGYSSAPSIAFQDTALGAGAEASWYTAASTAKLIPIIEDGQITGVIIKEPGVGYSSATITVTGDGDGCTMTADLSIGSIQTLQANNEILVEAGQINAISVVSGGYGYGVAYVEVQGDGTGCTATATIDSASGKISKINITNPGKGYTFANVVITGNGHAASARAIMSPYGGHGKNSPDELFANTLMFYSNISTDLVQGLSVNNDYRQVGIIKNPRKFADTTKFTTNIGTACYLLQGREGNGPINVDHFPRDTDIVVSRVIGTQTFERLYRVVTSTPQALLVQSLDNDVPQVNDSLQTFRYGTGTISGSKSTKTITGSGTKFMSEIDIGTKIYTAGGVYIGVVQSVTTDTSLTLVSNASIDVIVGTVFYHVGVDGDAFQNDQGNVFTITTVAPPTVDKYSGQLMFIDNKAGFTPSTEETVTLRTVIKF